APLVVPHHVVQGDRRLLVGGRAVDRQTQRPAARSVDDARHAGAGGGAQQVVGAADVGGIDLGGVGGEQPVVGGAVEDGVAAGDGGGQRRRVAEGAPRDFELHALQQVAAGP